MDSCAEGELELLELILFMLRGAIGILRIVLENRSEAADERMKKMYSDESYVQHLHQRADLDVLHHSIDATTGYGPNKSRPIHFVFTITGNGKRGDAGLVPSSVWDLCPTKRSDNHSDYLEVFNSEDDLAWFREQLLPKLDERSLDFIAIHPTMRRNHAQLLMLES